MNARQLIEAEDPKSFLHQAHIQPFTVVGRLMAWQVDGAGRILGTKRLMSDPALYHSPTLNRFNVREYRLRHGHPPRGEVPIHDISYWGEGLYFPCQEECKYRGTNPAHPYYRKDPDNLAYRDIDVEESEDPKQIFQKLPRATPVYMKDISFEDRPDVDPEMRWVAMWTTPFMIEHRREIRGCPAGVGREKWPAIRDLIDQTNKESGTKFFFNFSAGFTSYVKQTLEAEDPKGFFQKQMPLVDISLKSPARRCGICGARTVNFVRVEGVKLPICQDCHSIGFQAALQRESCQEAEDPKSFLQQDVPVAYQLTWADTAGKLHISRLAGSSPEDAEETLHFGYANVYKVIEIKPMSRAAYLDYYSKVMVRPSRQHEAEDPKVALRAAAGRVTHHVVAQEASWGIDSQGNVLYYQPDPDAFPSDYQGIYPDVVKFDTAEHLKYWGDLPSDIDISDIGFWLKDGTYDAADEQYRQDIKGGSIAR